MVSKGSQATGDFFTASHRGKKYNGKIRFDSFGIADVYENLGRLTPQHE
jgi:hypothetical protein